MPSYLFGPIASIPYHLTTSGTCKSSQVLTSRHTKSAGQLLWLLLQDKKVHAPLETRYTSSTSSLKINNMDVVLYFYFVFVFLLCLERKDFDRMRNKSMTKLVDVRQRLHLWIIAGSSMVNVTKGSPGQGQVVLLTFLIICHFFHFLYGLQHSAFDVYLIIIIHHKNMVIIRDFRDHKISFTGMICNLLLTLAVTELTRKMCCAQTKLGRGVNQLRVPRESNH